MTITIPIPPLLLPKLEAFQMECLGLTSNELILPPNSLYLECREAVYEAPEFSNLRHSFRGPIYINMKDNTITGVVMPKRVY